MKKSYLSLLREVSSKYGILPTCKDNVTKDGKIAYASGGFADIWRGHLDGKQVCIKAFRTQKPEDLEKMKQVCASVPTKRWV